MKFLSVLTSIFISVIIFSSCEKEKENELPSIEILSPSNGAEFDLGDDITISAEASDTDGSITEVRFYVNGAGVGSANSFPYNFTWNTTGEEEGVQEVKVTAIDNDGGSFSDEIVVILDIMGSLPVADFTADETSIIEGDTIRFTDLSTGASSWLWIFGDGTTSTDQNPIHIYSSPGTYSVVLTVTNELGSDTQTRTDFISVDINEGSGTTGTFTDPRDNNIYKTVKIGNQWWMAENLAWLPEVSPSSDESFTLPKYYVYGYQGNGVEKVKTTDNYKTYGVLYNWPAAERACPEGWHLPLDEEWELMAAFISNDNGGYSKDDDDWNTLGLRLKSTTGWDSGGNGTDDYGFNALPSGERQIDGTFGRQNFGTNWWSDTEAGIMDAFTRALTSDSDVFYRYYYLREGGFAVRCVKD